MHLMFNSLLKRTIMSAAALALTITAVSMPGQLSAQPATTSATVSKWEPKIQAFEKTDKEVPPPKNPILFVGSSSIVGWDVKSGFPGKPVLNRGFGGSRVSDVLEYFDRVVTPYAPEIVVLYSGDNDISGGMTPQAVANDVEKFVKLIQEKVPTVKRTIIIPPKPSESRFKLWLKMKEVGKLERALAAKYPNVLVVDMSDEMIGPEGKPRPELYKKDKLHMTPAGYDIWNKKLLPHLSLP